MNAGNLVNSIAIKKLIEYFIWLRPLLTLLACMFILVGLLISKSMISSGMIALACLFVLNPYLPQDFKRFVTDKSLWILTLIFFLYLFSGIYSSDTHYLIERLRIKLPFLFIPATFITVRHLPKYAHFIMIYTFLLLISIISIGVMAHYLMNFQMINESILFGKVIPAPVNHIRLSLMCVIAIIFGGYLYWNKFSLFFRGERWLTGGLTIFLIFFLHVFAVRSGLATFYMIVFVTAIYLALRKRYRLTGILIMLLMMIVPVLTWYTVDTFKNKVRYARYDIEQFLQGKQYEGLSDSKRLVSMQAGLTILKDHPVLGVGVGDTRNELNALYEKNHPYVPANTIVHNQYLFIAASTGVLGLLIAMVAFLLPLFHKKHFKHLLFSSIHLVLLFSFLVEATLEIQVGLTMYIIFTLLALNLLLLENKKWRENAL